MDVGVGMDMDMETNMVQDNKSKIKRGKMGDRVRDTGVHW